MKKIITISFCLLLVASSLFAQNKSNVQNKSSFQDKASVQNNSERYNSKSLNVPAVGSWSVGVSFNMLGLGSAVSQPEDGDGALSFITGSSSLTERQMFVIAKNPLALIQFKHRKSENWATRIGIGFSGSHIDYREYVFDDLARKTNPESEARVADRVKSDMNTVSLSYGWEYSTGNSNIKLILGGGFMYVVGGGKINIDYGNKMTVLNPKPTTSGDLLDPANEKGAKYINDFKKNTQGIEVARPIERYSVGYTHGLGINMEIGVEYHFIKKASLQATVNFIPVMGTFQPQTYTTYEGFSSKSGNIEKYNDLISPGSWGLLYGTQNIGINIGLNYYF